MLYFAWAYTVYCYILRGVTRYNVIFWTNMHSATLYFARAHSVLCNILDEHTLCYILQNVHDTLLYFAQNYTV